MSCSKMDLACGCNTTGGPVTLALLGQRHDVTIMRCRAAKSLVSLPAHVTSEKARERSGYGQYPLFCHQQCIARPHSCVHISFTGSSSQPTRCEEAPLTLAVRALEVHPCSSCQPKMLRLALQEAASHKAACACTVLQPQVAPCSPVAVRQAAKTSSCAC